MTNGFQFKQFFIAHDQCAMKVNTDGILLGCLAEVNSAQHILDLGTGTGLVAIMLAQRSTAHITAVEIEPNAYQQAVKNCENSAFSNRLQVIKHDVLTLNLTQKFDTIVANPPYFEHSLSSRSPARDLARATTQSHLNWLKVAKNHLNGNGKISFILPFDVAEKLISQSELLGLYCVEQWHICTKIGKAPKRMVATFSQNKLERTIHLLNIYDHSNSYSPAFKVLTQAFYLNF